MAKKQNTDGTVDETAADQVNQEIPTTEIPVEEIKSEIPAEDTPTKEVTAEEEVFGSTKDTHTEEVKTEEKSIEEAPAGFAVPAEEGFAPIDGGADNPLVPAPSEEAPKGDGTITEATAGDGEQQSVENELGLKAEIPNGAKTPIVETTEEDESKILEQLGEVLKCDHTTGGLKAKVNQMEGATFAERAEKYAAQWMNALEQG